MILKRKIFSTDKAENSKSPKDANAMTQLGKVGLGAAGLLGLGAGIEGGRSMRYVPSLSKEIDNIKGLKDNKVIRSSIKDQLGRIPIPGAKEIITDKVHFLEKNPPKFSKIDKFNRGVSILNKGSKLSRTILNNAEDYSKLGVEHLKKKHAGKLSKAEIDVLDKAPKTVGKASKMFLHWKNARGLGRGAKWAAGIGGLMYLNGRSLQQGSDLPVTSLNPVGSKSKGAKQVQ